MCVAQLRGLGSRRQPEECYLTDVGDLARAMRLSLEQAETVNGKRYPLVSGIWSMAAATRLFRSWYPDRAHGMASVADSFVAAPSRRFSDDDRELVERDLGFAQTPIETTLRATADAVFAVHDRECTRDDA